MDEASLGFLAARLHLAYFPRGTLIVGPANGVTDRLNIVKQGRVRGSAEIVAQRTVADVVLGEGEVFPIAALVGRRAAVYAYRAEDDTFCWQLAAEDFHRLLERSARFRDFCTDQLAMLVERSYRAQREQAAEALGAGVGMLAPLRTVVTREAVSCAEDTPIGEVLEVMHARRIGSMVVVDARRMPVGIFTTFDALDRVARISLPIATPISRVMTPKPVLLEEEAPLIEAAVSMARHAIHHVVVTRDGRLTGVISERDLFALQRASLRRATERVRAADEPGQLVEAAAEVRRLTHHLLAQGIDAEHVTQMTSALNDGLSRRLIELAARRRALPGQWCWLALGSEGRLEQTLATDQDNALVFAVERDPGEVRAAFVEFADEVNRGLQSCGFPLCAGDIMARNPRWCLALEEWRHVFGGWIRNTQPEALLHAAIFFDFRPVAGETALAGSLREAVLAQTRASPAFVRAMAGNALQVRPPLGLLRDFKPDDSEFPGTIDLKRYGARPFVDAARVLALAHGLPATGTAARLRAATAAGVLRQDEASAANDAFHFIQSLRLRRQHLEGELAPGTENRIDPKRLNAIDRRILKESFRQAVLVQERLRLDYDL